MHRLNFTVCTDSFIHKYNSVAVNNAVKVYANVNGFIYVYPTPTKSAAVLALGIFYDTFFINNKLFYDGAPTPVVPNNRFKRFSKSFRYKDTRMQKASDTETP